MARITIIGAGFAGLTAVRALRRKAPDAEITLIAPTPEFVYYPSLIWVPTGLRRGQDLVLGMSALLTTTMPEMRKVIEGLTEKGIRDRVKVIVGGAPVNQTFAQKIGADGYAHDAGEAVALVKDILARRK